jgi:hypothetical protein
VKALFEFVAERGRTELVGRELGGLASRFARDLDRRDLVARAWTPATVRRAMATEVAEHSGRSDFTGDGLAFGASRGRTDHLAVSADTSEKLLEDLHRVRAHARGAVPRPAQARGARWPQAPTGADPSSGGVLE